EVHLAGDGYAVIAHHRRSPLLLDEDRLGLRTERDADRIRETRGPFEDLLAGRRTEDDLLVSHRAPPRAVAPGYCCRDQLIMGERQAEALTGVNFGRTGPAPRDFAPRVPRRADQPG